jgi:RsiW-degrading membrane proteinase PrsW (M82 family)
MPAGNKGFASVAGIFLTVTLFSLSLFSVAETTQSFFPQPNAKPRTLTLIVSAFFLRLKFYSFSLSCFSHFSLRLFWCHQAHANLFFFNGKFLIVAQAIYVSLESVSNFHVW